jgi:methylthioribose-1-phosphate isomerase
LTVAQNYNHHLEDEVHERYEQLKTSQAQAVKLQNAIEHLQELLSQDEEPEEPDEDPEEVEGSSGEEGN